MLRPLRAGEASKPLTEILRSEDSVVQAPALTLHPRHLAGPEQTQQDGEENQAVVKPEHHRQGEHLEEGDEDVRGGGSQEDEGEEGGDPSVEDGWADSGERCQCSLVRSSLCCQVSVANVDGVVNTKANCQHDVDATDDVDGDVPEV